MADNDSQTGVNRGAMDKKLEAVGWGLFFIWLGVALLGKAGWGVWLLGVGLITLGMQAARRYFALRADRFWLVVGFLFVVGGIWELFRVSIGLVPVLCIIAGAALLVSALVRGPKS